MSNNQPPEQARDEHKVGMCGKSDPGKKWGEGAKK